MPEIKRYLVFNIGCIECGVSSNVVGTYDTLDEANRVADRLEEKLDWREGGQNYYRVYDLWEEQDVEYSKVLNQCSAATEGK